MSDHSGRARSRRGWVLLLIVSLLLIAGGAAGWILLHRSSDLDPAQYHSEPLPTASAPTAATEAPGSGPVPTESVTEPPAVTTTEALQDNPVDFPALTELNDDVYAWLYLPMGEGRDIDLPVLQSKLQEDDNFYLHKDIHRNYLFAGCLYTQKANAKDFSDRVTVIYGHNMLDGTMFSNLVFFQDERFFEEHEFFYIYTPGHILTYRIAAAIQFDTRHLLNCFDFSDDRVYENWIQNYILQPRSMIRATRKDLELSVEDKLVILSTCLEHGASRYLIQGVLISDEPTK